MLPDYALPVGCFFQQVPTPETEDLYDAAGRHLGGVHPPLLLGPDLTEAYCAKKLERPYHRIIWRGDDKVQLNLGLVWMAPIPARPLLMTDYVRAALVHALDCGQSVVIHADNEDAIHSATWHVLIMTGGGHA